MKKIPFLFLSILLFVGCSDHKENPMTNETLKTALVETWIFPTNSAFDRLKIDEKGEYELFEKKIDHSVNSFNGEYQIEEGLKVVILNHFGYFEIKSLTSNSVCIVLYNEAAQTKEEVTLTAKVSEKLLPNKEKHLSKIVNFANIFYPEDFADIVYSGDKLYRYTRYNSNEELILASPRIASTKSPFGVDTETEFSDFVYASDKVTFSISVYFKDVIYGIGNTQFIDCVVTLDSYGRAQNVTMKGADNQMTLVCGYTVDGYIETMALDDYTLRYTYEEGNPVTCTISLGDEEATATFSDFSVENKSSSWLPITTLTEVVEPLQLAGLYGKPFKRLPKNMEVTLLSEPDGKEQIKCIYETDAQGWIKKINLKLFAIDDDGKEEIENLINYEYQYK